MKSNEPFHAPRPERRSCRTPQAVALPHGSWGSLKYSSLWAPSTSRPSNIHTYLSLSCKHNLQTSPLHQLFHLIILQSPCQIEILKKILSLGLWRQPEHGSPTTPRQVAMLTPRHWHSSIGSYFYKTLWNSQDKKNAYKANSRRSREQVIFWSLSLEFQHHSEFLGTRSFGNWGGVVWKCISPISS